MKVGRISSIQRRFDPVKINGVISYGERNNYPQEVRNLVNNSVTGSSCLKIYKSFINGNGFSNGEYSQLLSEIVNDLCTFGGFAILVNYNANFEVSSLYHIPFEHVRLAYNGICAKIHTDWAKENTYLKPFNSNDIVNIPFYNPDNVANEVIAAGGWEYYKGQVYYYSNKGENCYPLPVFDAALVDMSTEEAISDITHRNAKNGFYPAGLLVNISSDADAEDDTAEYIQRLQGSQDSAKIGYCQVANETEIPKFVSFNGTNYDKDFQVSREAAKDNIIKAFQMPPILASENLGAGFGADLIINSYKLYNAITKIDRIVICNAFSTLLPDKEWLIQELHFEDESVDKKAVVDIITNDKLTTEQKKNILTLIYKISDVEDLL